MKYFSVPERIQRAIEFLKELENNVKQNPYKISQSLLFFN